MTRLTMFIGPFLLLLVASSCPGQDSNSGAEGSAAEVVGEASADPNLAAIQSGAKAFSDAFNQADAAAIADLWTVDGEYIDAQGNTYTGRRAIEQAYEEFFSANRDAKISIGIESFRHFSNVAIIEEGSTLVEGPGSEAAVSRYQAVHVKIDGEWKMASVKDALVDAPVAKQNLEDLNFLIGTWKAEEHGNQYVSTNHWITNRSFVQREFTTTLIDGSQTSGVQLIGWNPQAGHVQSWSFSADGGHAVGIWLPSDDGWIAETQGMTGTGLATSSTNLLRRLDDNAYVWQSIDRTVGDNTVSDTGEVVIKRQPLVK